MRKYFSLIRDVQQHHAVIAEEFAKIYESYEGMWETSQKNQQCQIEIDQQRASLEGQMNDDVFMPLSEYMGQYKTLKDRCSERDKRKIDMDRFRGEVKSLTEKPPKDPSKLPNAQAKYNCARKGYEDLNSEVCRDMGALYFDRIKFTDPILATFVTVQHTFFDTASRQMSEVSRFIQHIDRSAIHRHARVISESSAAQNDPYAVGAGGAQTGPPQNVQTFTGSQTMSGPPTRVNYPQGGGGYNQGPPQGGYNGSASVGGYNPGPSQGGYNGGGGAPGGFARGGATGGPPARPQSVSTGPPRMVAQALYAFTAQSPAELSFNFGDRITILTQQGEWWQGEINGKQGLIPSNYVQLIQ